MSKRIRIKDIAEKANVSTGTVDRVLHKRGRVSEEARQKVLEAMEELNYRPNLIASALAHNKTWRIAVMIPNPDNDPFWAQPLKGLQRGWQSVRDYGVALEYFYWEDGDTDDFNKQAKNVLSGQFDGLIIAPLFLKESQDLFDQCAEQGLKYIQINTYVPRTDDYFLCYIGQKSFDSGVLAAKLLDFGMQDGDTALVLHLEKEITNSNHLIQKEKGFEQYFQDNKRTGITLIEAAFPDVEDKTGLQQFLTQQFSAHPTINGIFVTTSKMFHILPTLEQLNKMEIKLVGFDLIQENIDFLTVSHIDFLINQNPLKQGFLSIINIFNHLILKKDIQPLQYLPLDVVMKENMEYYIGHQNEELHLMI